MTPLAPSANNPRCIHGVDGCTCLDALGEVEAAPSYRVVDGVFAGSIVTHAEVRDSDCLRCGGLDSECRTCLGVGYVLGWEHETNRPTGRLEPVK